MERAAEQITLDALISIVVAISPTNDRFIKILVHVYHKEIMIDLQLLLIRSPTINSSFNSANQIRDVSYFIVV